MKTVLDWLLDMEHLNSLFLGLGIALPLLGLAGGVVWSKMNDVPLKKGLLKGGLIGALGIVLELYWLLYNAVTDYYGLDTVKNLLMQLAIAATIGVAIGLVFRVVFSGKAEEHP